jgi:hypothetical protein
MRNYQTLTLIGSITGILTAVGFWIFASSFSAGLESLNESGFADRNTVTQNRGTMSYASVAVPVVLILEIIVLVLVFVIKPNQLKPIGIFLIAVSVIVLIGTSWYGILPSTLFLLQYYIGCSGWSYSSCQGPFYPDTS